MSLLQVRRLKVAYGGIQAVRGIDFEVNQGELVCMIGANGAGKSSCLKGLLGMVPLAGEIHFDGARIAGKPTHEIAALGISMVPEGRGVFARLTVDENLDMGAFLRRDKSAIRADLNKVYGLFPRLGERHAQLAGTLSGGEQQMLAIGRALMSRPRLLLLDEPSMGLAPLMVNKIYDTIAEIAREGVTILLVEQNANLALKISQRAYVMESGTITMSGNSADLADDSQVRAAYLGD
jgi:branched-chain amino acid transport system ATP-binding protein